MMKKIITATLLSALVLGAVTPTALAGEAKSNGKVQFTQNGTPGPNPVNPTIPGGEVIEKDPENPGSDGFLRFDRVPAFNFGEINLDGQEINQPVLQTKYTKTAANGGGVFYAAPQVQITDATGSNLGWIANVAMSAFKLMDKTDPTIEDIKNVELDGAEIRISNSHVNSYSNLSDTYAPTAEKALTLKSGVAAQTFASATGNKGMSQWGVSYISDTDLQTTGNIGYPSENTDQGTEEAVKLHVPTATKKLVDRTYQSTMTWTIVAGPENP